MYTQLYITNVNGNEPCRTLMEFVTLWLQQLPQQIRTDASRTSCLHKHGNDYPSANADCDN